MLFFVIVAASMSLSHSLKALNTLGLDQSCTHIIRVDSIDMLVQTCLIVSSSSAPMLILGGGSNLVFLEDFIGTVVQIATKGIKVVEDDTHYLLDVQAGESWHGLVEFCLKKNMPGLENMALIPGTVGAAPVQNIGAYGVELSDVCDWVEYLDLNTQKIVRLKANECEFAYRESVFKSRLRNTAVITRVGFRLAKKWHPNLSYGPLQSFDDATVIPKQIFDSVCQIRREKLPDPDVLGNVGSFFKNPLVDVLKYQQLALKFPNIVGYAQADGTVKLAAGWLIEQAGLKGYTTGRAGVHEKQALVLVNLGGATGADICTLAKYVIEQVALKFDVILEAEPRIIGKHGEITINV